LEKIQNLSFDENELKINAKKSRELKMIVLKNIPFKLRSEELTELIVSSSLFIKQITEKKRCSWFKEH
jgi:hypothetical protein